MGEVWQALNVGLGRRVAIKILLPEHAASQELSERFTREARAANLVRHRNIVDVLDVGEDESGAPYMVQELLEGENLASYLAGLPRRLTVAQAMAIYLPVVEAVAHAHAKGVVHRDLKPENVFLARQGDDVVPKLLDFGISHIITETNIRMTATGVVMGTPAYMAPEQIEGTRRVDMRTDVWALGVLLHEMFSGMLPFRAESPGSLFIQIATGTPIPLHDVAPHVPIGIERVVDKCLKRSQDERFANAGELLRAMRAALARASAADIDPESERPIDLRLAPELPDLPTTAAPPPQPRSAVRVAPVASVPVALARGRDGELDLEPAGASKGLQLKLASIPPPRPQTHSRPNVRPASRLRTTLSTTLTAVTERRVLSGTACLMATLIVCGMFTALSPWSEGWPIAPLASAVLAVLPTVALAAPLAVSAVVAGLHGSTAKPRSPAHFIAAAAWLSLALVLLFDGNPHSHALVWGGAFAVCGLGAVGVRGATEAWVRKARAGAVVFVVLSAGALFVAGQLLRAPG
jgi:serine/threonine protein kinase